MFSWEELKKILLEDQWPSIGIRKWVESDKTELSLELRQLWGIPQDPQHHPEGSVETHILEVIDRAIPLREGMLEKNRLIFMLACLLHDVGKYTNTFYRTEPKKLHKFYPGIIPPKDSRIVAYGHDVGGESLAKRFLQRFTDDEEILRRVPTLVRFHMRPLLSAQAGDKAFIKMASAGCEMYMIGMISWADKGKRSSYWFKIISRLRLD